MKKISLLTMMLIAFTMTQAQTIYLIRHAEKIEDGTKNPVLSDQGQHRSKHIAHMLSEANITQIYSSNYNRTQQTAKPLSDLLGIAITSYDPRKLNDLAEIIKQKTHNILVVGHSNTTPQLTELLLEQPVKQLTEKDYDYIFQVVISGENKQLNILKSQNSN